MEQEIQDENKALIQDMLQRAQRADEPGDPNKIIHEGNDNVPSPMVVTTLRSAGYSYIWDTVTHERSLINNNMLPSAFKKKRPDGSRVFTADEPKELPARGTLKCMLHSDNPNREYYDSLGLPVCLKANLTSPFQVKRHMQKRHKMEYEALEEERLQAEKDRNIQLQEALIKATTSKVQETNNKPYVSETQGINLDISSNFVEKSQPVMDNKPELYVSDKPKKVKRKKR